LKEGLVIGNETPGILKYYDIYTKPGKIAVGVVPNGERYSPQIQLMPNEVFTNPAVFIFLFKDDLTQSKETLSTLISEYISETQALKYKVLFESVSNDTTESSLIEKAKQAKDSGADVFCLSGNWTDKRGDWTYEKINIKNVSEYVHSLGMKFGLCIDLAVAEPESIILTQHPRWVVKSKNGSDYDLSENNAKLMCLASEYDLYMAYEIDAIVKELNVDYIKLTGDMFPLADEGGCFAKDHLHNTSGESMWRIYDGLFAIIKYLHGQNWDLLVDVSLDKYNMGLLDYALLKYANVQWMF
jgi:alpha-galactosidase